MGNEGRNSMKDNSGCGQGTIQVIDRSTLGVTSSKWPWLAHVLLEAVHFSKAGTMKELSVYLRDTV